MTRQRPPGRMRSWLEARGLGLGPGRDGTVSLAALGPGLLWRSGAGLVTLWLACQVPTGLVLVAGGHPLAGLVADLHRTGGELVLAALVLHLGRAVWVGAWRPPRELVWLSGGLALLLVLGLELSGVRLGPLWPGREGAGPLARHLALALTAAVAWAVHLALGVRCPPPEGEGLARQPWWPAGCLSWAVVALGGLILWLALAAYAPGGGRGPWWRWPWRGLVELVGGEAAWGLGVLGAVAAALLPWWGRRSLRLVRLVAVLALGLGAVLGLWGWWCW